MVRFRFASCSQHTLSVFSHFTGRRKNRRHDWPAQNALHRSSHIRSWRRSSNIHQWLSYDVPRTNHQRCWRWSTIVRRSWFKLDCSDLWFLRTIVPIYQSEISPPNHVRLLSYVLLTTIDNLSERKAGMHRIYRKHHWLHFFCGLCHDSFNLLWIH